MVKGDIILATFPFTDLSGTKLRPAVVLAESQMDVTICLLRQLHWLEPTDFLLTPSAMNGLKNHRYCAQAKLLH